MDIMSLITITFHLKMYNYLKVRAYFMELTVKLSSTVLKKEL